MPLYPKYERLLENYDDVTDMCNQLGLNYDEVYEVYEDEEDGEDE